MKNNVVYNTIFIIYYFFYYSEILLKHEYIYTYNNSRYDI